MREILLVCARRCTYLDLTCTLGLDSGMVYRINFITFWLYLCIVCVLYHKLSMWVGTYSVSYMYVVKTDLIELTGL